MSWFGPTLANGLILTVLIVIIVRTVPLTPFLLRLDESVVIHTSSQRANAACVLPLPSSLMGRCSFSFLIACNETPTREAIRSYLDLSQDERTERGKSGSGGKELEYEERIDISSSTPTAEAGVRGELLQGCSTGLRTADGAVQNPGAQLPPQLLSEDTLRRPCLLLQLRAELRCLVGANKPRPPGRRSPLSS